MKFSNPLPLWEARQLCPKLTVNDCVKWNRRSTLESLGSLKMILTLSGSSGCGSGGRHSDFRSFSSCSVCNVKREQEQWACTGLPSQHGWRPCKPQAGQATPVRQENPTTGTAPTHHEHPGEHSSLSSTQFALTCRRLSSASFCCCTSSSFFFFLSRSSFFLRSFSWSARKDARYASSCCCLRTWVWFLSSL